MKKYIMTLTPVGSFCFGKESIRVNRLKEKNTDSFFYFSESMMMPQQTALLGMLRYALLSIADTTVFENNKIKDSKKASTLIGEQSFTKGRNNSFGKIEAIGACGLQIKLQNNTRWQSLKFAPMDYNLKVSKSSGENGCRTLLNAVEDMNLSIDGYKAKDGLNNERLLVVSNDNVIKEYKYSDIFKEVVQVGINRNIVTGHVEDNSYYKQQFYRFANGKGDEKFNIRFCFSAVLDETVNTDQLQGMSVQLGSDDSRFILNCQEDGEIQPVYENSSSSALPKITLMSDSYLTPEDIALSFFNITEIKPFRSISTTVETKDYYSFKIGVNKDCMLKSERSYLYARGSVFYFDNEAKKEQFRKSLEEGHQEFYKIGYNQYK